MPSPSIASATPPAPPTLVSSTMEVEDDRSPSPTMTQPVSNPAETSADAPTSEARCDPSDSATTTNQEQAPKHDSTRALNSSATPPRTTSYRAAVKGLAKQTISPSTSRERPRGLLPTPEALAAVRRLYEDGQHDPAEFLAAAKAAQPEAITDAPFSIKARVSSSLFGVSRPALVLGLTAVKDNATVCEVIESGDILHVHRQPRDSLVLYLRSESAKQRLAGQRCQYLGRTLTFEALNPLSDAFYRHTNPWYSN